MEFLEIIHTAGLAAVPIAITLGLLYMKHVLKHYRSI